MQEHASPWSRPSDRSGAIPSSARVDVCVIGAGIAGLAVAYHAVKDGRSVMVLDDGPIGGGETGHTTAHLASAVDDRYYEIERLHGADGARICAASHAAAVDRYEQITRTERIDCQFRRVDGYLFRSSDAPQDVLERELDAARRAGLSVESIADLKPGAVSLGPALRFRNQAAIEPLKFLAGLAEGVERHGGQIFSGAHVEKIESGSPLQVTVQGGPALRASHVVVATNSPVNTLVKFHTKQAAYRTYVIAATIDEQRVPHDLYWDTGSHNQPYHYVRTHVIPSDDGQPGRCLLIVGGEDHRTGQANDADQRWERLEGWTRARFPIGEVENRWSGQCEEPVDCLAYIGRINRSENLYVCTGDSGNGMTHGMIAGILISDLISGRQNHWSKLYDPSRISPLAMGSFLSENLNTAAQYFDWLKAGDVRNTAEIKVGHGAVVRRGAQLLAVYRDPDQNLHACSAVCPHLKGIVAWNDEAKSWDCPCHGSRFDVHGQVLNGPANGPLEVVHLQEPQAAATR